MVFHSTRAYQFSNIVVERGAELGSEVEAMRDEQNNGNGLHASLQEIPDPRRRQGRTLLGQAT